MKPQDAVRQGIRNARKKHKAARHVSIDVSRADMVSHETAAVYSEIGQSLTLKADMALMLLLICSINASEASLLTFSSARE